MSLKKGGKTKKHLLLAKLVTSSKNSVPCAFCNRVVDDEIIYGKLYAIGDIQCHYFCVLLSCCLVQKGKDEEGLFGFLYPDIVAEVERSKKHKCSYCGRDGATLGCTVSQCRKQFHLPCGRERNAVSLFYGNFKSFCERHAPVQRVNDEIMAKARPRKAASRKLKMLKSKAIKRNLDVSDSGIENTSCNENTCPEQHTLQTVLSNEEEQNQEPEQVCVICYESVDGFPTLNTFWPPCCARDAWFHRSCLQRMALSAGMHYLKCPLCNRKEAFYEAVMSQGYYVPDRDASWELEQNAFAEIYERLVTCSAPECSCPMGRDYDADAGAWDIRLCVLCGSSGIHAQCSQTVSIHDEKGENNENKGNDFNAAVNARHVCVTCAPVAPEDLDKLVINTENARVTQPVAPEVRGRPMPSRMSLRRTKQRALRHLSATASESSQGNAPLRVERENEELETSKELEASRLELNLKAPEKPSNRLIEPTLLRNVENKLLSPLKLLEQGLMERIPCEEAVQFEIDPVKLISQMRERFTKPKPLVEKKKIVNDILESMLENLQRDKMKTKGPLKEWNSPKKCVHVEATEENPTENQPPIVKEEKQDKDFTNPPIDNGENELIEVFRIIDDKEENILEECKDNVLEEHQEHIFEKPNEIVVEETEEHILEDSKENLLENSTEEDSKNNQESDSSNTTFKLHPEFIVDNNSNGLPHFESPKKKPVLVQNSSMEISHEDNVSIDLVNDHTTPTKSKESSRTIFKLSPTDGQMNRLEIDIESFKCHYLNEVDRDYKSENVIVEKSERERKRKFDGKKLDNSMDGNVDRKVKRRRKANNKKSIHVKVRWRNPASKYMMKYPESPNERRLIQTSIHSFFGAKHTTS